MSFSTPNSALASTSPASSATSFPSSSSPASASASASHFSKPLPLRINSIPAAASSPVSSSPTLSPSSSASSPSASPRTSSLSRRTSMTLTLDFSTLPPPVTSVAASAAATATATVPTNTLLFTNLLHEDIFRPDNLQTLRDLVETTAALHSWAPLRSMRRIIASFYSADDAARVRAAWDGEHILGQPCQLYYGRATPLDCGLPGQVQHLALPDAGKLFFISPPPSPPHGWEMRLEGAPNKQVHADDLAEALAKLHHQAGTSVAENGAAAAAAAVDTPSASPQPKRTGTRSRSSTLIYQPAEHGSHPDLPAIAVEDMTTDNDNDDGHGNEAAMFVDQPLHTVRPPVELMQDA